MFRHRILNDRSLDSRYKALTEGPLAIEEIAKELVSGTDAKTDRVLEVLFFYRTPSINDIISAEIIAQAIHKRLVELQTEFITIDPVLPAAESIPNRLNERVRSSESTEHQGMKRWVVAFLQSKGIAGLVQEEVGFLGYEVDVASGKDGVFIECGDTEPRKVLTFLMSGFQIGILQYNSESILWFIPNPGSKGGIDSLIDGRLA